MNNNNNDHDTSQQLKKQCLEKIDIINKSKKIEPLYTDCDNFIKECERFFHNIKKNKHKDKLSDNKYIKNIFNIDIDHLNIFSSNKSKNKQKKLNKTILLELDKKNKKNKDEENKDEENKDEENKYEENKDEENKEEYKKTKIYKKIYSAYDSDVNQQSYSVSGEENSSDYNHDNEDDKNSDIY